MDKETKLMIVGMSAGAAAAAAAAYGLIAQPWQLRRPSHGRAQAEKAAKASQNEVQIAELMP